MKPTIQLGRPLPFFSFAFQCCKSYSKAWAAIIFVFFYLSTALYLRNHNYRDPTSAFFSSARGYDKIYSLERQKQAHSYIETAKSLNKPHLPNADPILCLAVATVGRPGEQYVRDTVGSLLVDLDEEDRRGIHFVFFIAHTDPHVHPIYGEKWVENLPDTLLTYNLNDTEISKVKMWEEEKDYRSKGLFDYSYLLKACYDTGAEYVAMVEGDVIAVDGWYRRAISAAKFVEMQMPWHGEDSAWLYIRMFYTEAYLGWNVEEWPTYFGWSFLLLLTLSTSLVAARTYSQRLQKELSNITLAVICFICLPACILLYFSAGKASVQPPTPGVHRMDNFGCCSQGFIFSRHAIPLILDRIEHHSMDYIDMLMEAIADGEGLARWVVVPSLLQHIGGRSSKGDEIADSRAKAIWNFGFELYNTAKLRSDRTWAV